MKKEEYEAFGVPLDRVRNSNESKVIKYMEQIIPEFPEFDYCPICIQDVYALSLNMLPPKYIQKGTIVLKKELTDEDFKDVVESAVEKVTRQTNHPD